LDTILGNNFSSTEVVTEFLTCIDVLFKALQEQLRIVEDSANSKKL